MPSVDFARDLALSLAKLHILFHAGQRPVFGLWLIEELAEHGYRLGPGTLYPMLHSLENDGLLTSDRQVVAGKARKYYQATRRGKAALAQARAQVLELMAELQADVSETRPSSQA
jgi:DNA-binding PadR family transcriptional regulator